MTCKRLITVETRETMYTTCKRLITVETGETTRLVRDLLQ